ncbi:MAG: UDP-N-acetylmuramyl pentapeptide phosphotransferase [Thermovenabulum sp.]|uniref:UDP-N-acetylmuramyl pentapeptide phosphotransferase n=1 Tax=Thermovenabulum sp. TaxID=3100335 RepID=UPI003C7C1855
MIIVISIILTEYLMIQFLKWDVTKRKNYKGVEIPTAGGIIFIIVNSIMSIFLFTIFTIFSERLFILLNLIGTLTMGIFGLIDDTFGQRNVKGFRGHFFSFFKGNLTTGVLKAVFGFLISFLISFVKNIDNIYFLILDTFFICFFINIINLLDMRPGRACRFYLVLSILAMIIEFYKKSFYRIWLMLPLFCSVFVFLPYDVGEKIMMGDTGANVLGINLGIIYSWILPPNIKLILLSLLIFVNVLAEKYSISKILDKIGGR